ncbi:hypothetical protein B0I37DRAFT_349566 [Chaetomium sp. MPI-CAGE-AT-0009]|nr:hypothetical protein B0I37DRAFT_349566 [Chaetomium sp. MPI-CAGE-AT-0009]
MATTQPLPPQPKFARPLPSDITTDILAQSLSYPPTCALALLCPEWCICDRPDPELEAILRTTRVDTYTLPLNPPTATEPLGTISTTFDHTECDHILLPFMRDPREAYNITSTATGDKNEQLSPGDPRQAYHQTTYDDDDDGSNDDDNNGKDGWLPPDLQQALVRRWASSSVVVVSQPPAPRRLRPAWEHMDSRAIERMVLLRGDAAVRLLPYEDDNVAVCDVLDESVDPWVDVRRMESMAAVSLWGRLHKDRLMHFHVRWEALEQLETLFLDLRGYSAEYSTHNNTEISRIAGMLQGKHLKLLVIAGLRSWQFYPGCEPMTLEEVSRGELGGELDPNPGLYTSGRFGREVNMFKSFQGAVRPGGKLVLVDTARPEAWMQSATD